jgi:hypothetical protein
MTFGRYRNRRIAVGTTTAAAVAAYLVVSAGAQGPPTMQDLLADTFAGPTTAAPVLTLEAGAPGFPCLTAGPAGPGPSTIANCNLASPDAAGQGALRFTDVSEQQASAILYDTSLPTAQGLTITFKQYQYGGYGLGGPTDTSGGADGISFFLAAAPPHPATLGPQGGALGYASAGSSPGLPAGWLGIGLDAFGNYSNPTFGGSACPVPAWAGFTPNEITVRGPGNGTDGYCLLSSSIELGPNNPVGQGGASLRGTTRAASARTIQIVIDPSLGTYTVRIDPAGGTNFVDATSGPLPASYYDPADGTLTSGIPPRITFGFAASTGSATDIHEINGLSATTTSGGVPVLGLTKTTTLTGPAPPGTSFNYVVTPSVAGTVAENQPLSIRVSDSLPAGVTSAGTPSGTSWACTPTSASAFECAYGNPTPIPAGTSLPPISIPVTIDAAVAVGTTIVNTAAVISSDAASQVQASNTIVVAASAPLNITTASLPSGVVNAAYPGATLNATGGTSPYTWALQAGSALPPGLSLSTAGGITGTPTAAGTFTFTVRVTDSASASTMRSLSISVGAALAITTASLPNGTVNVAYPSTTLAATGGSGTRTWSIATGSLPPGLALSNAGVLTGTPTAAGTFNFTIRVTDASGSATRQFSIVVAAAALTITTTSPLPPGMVARGYGLTFQATGGTAPRQWSRQSGTIPPGLTLAAGGRLSGTPTTAGTFNFTVRVTDASGAFATRAMSLTITPTLAITPQVLPRGEVGAPYNERLSATGGRAPRTWSLFSGALPAGLVLSTSGVISGTPTTVGVVQFVVRVTDADGRTDNQGFAINVVPELTITTTSLPNGTSGVAYSRTLARTGGFAPFTWSIASGTLPPGLALSTAGVLAGTPTTAGTWNFTVRVRDSLGGVDGQPLRLIVAPAPPREKLYWVENAATGPPVNCTGELVVNDRATGVRRTIPTPSPDCLWMTAATPDGTRVFIAAYPSVPGGAPRLYAVDTATDAIVQTLSLPTIPRSLAVSRDNSTLGALLHDNSILVIDVASLTIRRSVTIGQVFPADVQLSSDGRLAYILAQHWGDHFIELITVDLVTGNFIARVTITAAFSVSQVALTPDGRKAVLSYQWAPKGPFHELAVVDLTTNVVTGRIRLTTTVWNFRIRDNARLYLLDATNPAVVQVSLTSLSVVDRIPLAARPDSFHVALEPIAGNFYAGVNRMITRVDLDAKTSTPISGGTLFLAFPRGIEVIRR